MKKLILGLLPVLFIVLTSRCTLADDIEKLKGAVDSLQLVIGTPSFETGVHLDFINAKTKNYVDETEVKVTVTGTHAQDVYNNLGVRENPFLSHHGMMELIIDPRKVDTTAMKTTPFEFDVTVAATGYNSVTQRVKLYGAGMEKISITLIKLNDAPAGISASANSNFVGTNSSGNTNQQSTINMNAGQQSVTIGAGVGLRDASGNPVTGTVAANVVYFDPTSQTAQDAFPGGLNVTAQMDDNSTEDIQFVSAGMFDVRLSAGGKKVSSFDNGGITLKTEVPAELTNPNTGQPLKENDVIELWSQDEGTGQWVFEKMDTVRKVNGKLVLEETVTHLSLWNWDFYYNMCSNGPRFVWRGNLTSEWTYGKITSKINNSWYNYSTYTPISTSAGSYYNNLQLYRVPSNVAAQFTFADAGWDAYRKLSFNPSTLNISNLCDGRTYYIDVTEQYTPIENITVNIDVSASSASNSQLVIRPNANLYYRQTASSYYYWSTMYLRNGKSTITLQLDKPYEIQAAFGNNYGRGTLRIEKSGTSKLKIIMTPNIQVGSVVNAGQPITLEVDRPANNVVTVKYNAVLPDNVFGQLRVKESNLN